jgi:hypothetical protein
MIGQRDTPSVTSTQCRKLSEITEKDIDYLFDLSNNSKANIVLLDYIIYNKDKFNLHYLNVISIGNEYINLEDKYVDTERKDLLKEINNIIKDVKEFSWLDKKCHPNDKLGIIKKLLYANNIEKDNYSFKKGVYNTLLEIGKGVGAFCKIVGQAGGDKEETGIDIEKEIDKRLNLIIIILEYLKERKPKSGGRKSHKQKTRKYKPSYKLSKTRKPIHKKSRKQIHKKSRKQRK